MLRVADHFERSDTGRQRRGNEDAFYARAPLFAVADGMGGAQAGEVASGMAVEVVEQGLPDGRAASRSACARSSTRPTRASTTLARADQQRAGHGHDADARLRRRGGAVRRPRRRQPPLPAARRRLRAADRRPLARRGARAPGQDHARGGRGAPAALDHHARARPRGGGRARLAHLAGARRRRLPDLQRRPDLDGPRGAGGRDRPRRRLARRRPAARSSTRPTRRAGATTSPSSSSRSRTSAPRPSPRRPPSTTVVEEAAPAGERHATAVAAPPQAAPAETTSTHRRVPREPRAPAPGGAAAAGGARARRADRGHLLPGHHRPVAAGTRRRPSTSSAPATTASSPSTAACPTTCRSAWTSTASTTTPACR